MKNDLRAHPFRADQFQSHAKLLETSIQATRVEIQTLIKTGWIEADAISAIK
jgi:hypothetical protein